MTRRFVAPLTSASANLVCCEDNTALVCAKRKKESGEQFSPTVHNGQHLLPRIRAGKGRDLKFEEKTHRFARCARAGAAAEQKSKVHAQLVTNGSSTVPMSSWMTRSA